MDVTDGAAARQLASLREAEQRKDEFVAILAHELRNPLAPIRYATQLLRRKAQAAADADLQRLGDIIERQVTDITRLLDDVLDLSSVALGKLRLRMAPVALAAVVDHALEWTRPLIEARRHRFSLRQPSHPLCVNGDAVRLAQVLSNLLGNAAKYTEIGGHIHLALERHGANAVIRVRDNGRGLDAADLKGLFELFNQPQRNIDRAEGGLGIGLSLVRSLVQMHGGHVEAWSAGCGKGSEFVVYLPLLRENTGA